MPNDFATRAEVYRGLTMPCFTERDATVDGAFRAGAARVPARIALAEGDRRYSYAALGRLGFSAAAVTPLLCDKTLPETAPGGVRGAGLHPVVS